MGGVLDGGRVVLFKWVSKQLLLGEREARGGQIFKWLWMFLQWVMAFWGKPA